MKQPRPVPRSKYFTLFRRSYGDFDIAHDEPVAFGLDRAVLLVAAAQANQRRTSEELEAEVGFWVSENATVVLL